MNAPDSYSLALCMNLLLQHFPHVAQLASHERKCKPKTQFQCPNPIPATRHLARSRLSPQLVHFHPEAAHRPRRY